MKHGFFIIGVDNGREFSFGRSDTYHQACKSYWFAIQNSQISEDVKKTLMLVELVEKDLPVAGN